MNQLFKARRLFFCQFISLLAILILTLITTPALANREGRARWWNTPAIADQLKLTDDEIQQLDEAYDDVQLLMIDLRGQLEVERLKLRGLLGKPDFDITEVVIQRQKEKQMYSRIADERFAFLLKVRKLIGPERFNKLMTIQEARGHYRHRRKSENVQKPQSQ